MPNYTEVVRVSMGRVPTKVVIPKAQTPPPAPPEPTPTFTADNALVLADTTVYTADATII